MNKRHQTDLILLDFSKAFDCVPHQRLLHKLNYYGISGPTLYWIKSFLSDRTQHVSINGSHSALANVTSGVPQGSVLGPVLFLLYINDITNQIQSNIRLFADDSDPITRRPSDTSNGHPNADRLVKEMANEFQHIKMPPAHNYSQAQT